MSVKSKTINLRELHEVVCHHSVEVELGVVKDAKEWLNLKTSTQDRLCLAISWDGRVYFSIRNFDRHKGDRDIKYVEMDFMDGQIVIDELFAISGEASRYGDRHFPLEEVKTVFERDYPKSTSS